MPLTKQKHQQSLSTVSIGDLLEEKMVFSFTGVIFRGDEFYFLEWTIRPSPALLYYVSFYRLYL